MNENAGHNATFVFFIAPEIIADSSRNPKTPPHFFYNL